MTTESQREKYRLIRYEYYHAGRLLQSIGNFHSAGIMLGYTVETIMKAGLLEVMSNEEQSKSKILNASHDILKIYNECRKHGLFKDIDVSNDFLEHVNNNFQRYPSQIQNVFEEANSKDNVLQNSINHINYYDDLIVKLDKHLLDMFDIPSLSIFYFALFTLETRYAQDILYHNAFGLNQFSYYEKFVRNNLPERDDLKESIKQNLAKGFNCYWNPRDPNDNSQGSSSILESYSAGTFSFQKWSDPVVQV